MCKRKCAVSTLTYILKRIFFYRAGREPIVYVSGNWIEQSYRSSRQVKHVITRLQITPNCAFKKTRTFVCFDKQSSTIFFAHYFHFLSILYSPSGYYGSKVGPIGFDDDVGFGYVGHLGSYGRPRPIAHHYRGGGLNLSIF